MAQLVSTIYSGSIADSTREVVQKGTVDVWRGRGRWGRLYLIRKPAALKKRAKVPTIATEIANPVSSILNISKRDIGGIDTPMRDAYV
jgi:hypothetical protein